MKVIRLSRLKVIQITGRLESEVYVVRIHCLQVFSKQLSIMHLLMHNLRHRVKLYRRSYLRLMDEVGQCNTQKSKKDSK